MDFLEERATEKIVALTDGKVDAVVSDMAPAAMGHQNTDHLRIMMLCEEN